MKGTALVAGADGLLGRSLVARLADLPDVTVRSVTRTDGDLRLADSWDQLPPADHVFQLAARTFVPDSWEHPRQFVQDNIAITSNALDYCRRHGSNMIYASSYLYGNPDRLPISESARIIVSNPYALSKRMCEEMVEHFSRMFGFPATVVRPFNIYGPRQDGRFLLPSIVQQAIHADEIKVMDLEPRRDYVFVDDVADAFLACAGAPSDFGVYNVGSGESYSVGEVAEIVMRLVGRQLPIVSAAARRESEIMDTRADIAKARERLGWEPKVSIEAGLRMLVDSVR